MDKILILRSVWKEMISEGLKEVDTDSISKFKSAGQELRSFFESISPKNPVKGVWIQSIRKPGVTYQIPLRLLEIYKIEYKIGKRESFPWDLAYKYKDYFYCESEVFKKSWGKIISKSEPLKVWWKTGLKRTMLFPINESDWVKIQEDILQNGGKIGLDIKIKELVLNQLNKIQ